MKTDRAYRDTSGRSLTDYPRPSVAVDTAVLAVAHHRLCVLLVGDLGGTERLPGTFIHPDETLRDAALRALRDKAAVDGIAPRQLRVFDNPTRDDRGWVLSVAHMDAVPADRIATTDHTRLVAVDDLPTLAFDHTAIVTQAAAALRDQYRELPDPWHLLPPTETGFTMRDLRLLHEAVLGERLVADTFRRTMRPHLQSAGAVRRGAPGKPAELFLAPETATGRTVPAQRGGSGTRQS